MLSSSNTRRRLYGTENGFCTLLLHLQKIKNVSKCPQPPGDVKINFFSGEGGPPPPQTPPRIPPPRRIAPLSEILNTTLITMSYGSRKRDYDQGGCVRGVWPPAYNVEPVTNTSSSSCANNGRRTPRRVLGSTLVAVRRGFIFNTSRLVRLITLLAFSYGNDSSWCMHCTDRQDQSLAPTAVRLVKSILRRKTCGLWVMTVMWYKTHLYRLLSKAFYGSFKTSAIYGIDYIINRYLWRRWHEATA